MSFYPWYLTHFPPIENVFEFRGITNQFNCYHSTKVFTYLLYTVLLCALAMLVLWPYPYTEQIYCSVQRSEGIGIYFPLSLTLLVDLTACRRHFVVERCLHHNSILRMQNRENNIFVRNRKTEKNTKLSRGCGGGAHFRTELEIDPI